MNAEYLVKKTIISFSIVVLLFSACKTRQPEVVYQKPKPVLQQPAPKPVVTPESKETLKQPKEFRIALLLPLYLEENSKIDTSAANPEIDQRSLPALSFYEGALLAADSLSKSGIKVTLNVYDISEDSSAKHFMLMNYRSLKSNDLTFAAFPSSTISEAAYTAKLYGLQIVFTQFGISPALKNNPNIVLASPSTTTQCKLATAFIVDKFFDSNFVILTRHNKREKELGAIFETETDSLLEHEFKLPQRSVQVNYPETTEEQLLRILPVGKMNILFFPSSDESYVSSVITGLDTLDVKLTLVGLPTWENFESVMFSKLKNIEVYIFSTSFIDYDDADIQQFRKNYISQYKCDPLINAYQGNELTFYFAKLFKEYDSSFYNHTADDSSHPVFKFVRESKEAGFENEHISVLKYEGYRLLKVSKR